MENNSEILSGPTSNIITVDLLIVGSGTGMAAALAGNERSLDCLVIEKTPYVGGSTARSGGAFWVPANSVLKAGGSDDTLEDGKDYLTAIAGPFSARWQNFLTYGNAAIEMLQRTTPMSFSWAKGYSDYHPENPGGAPTGRTCECKPFNMSILGKNQKRFRPGIMSAPVPMPVTGYDYKWINLMTKKPLKAFPIIFKRLFTGIGGRLIGKNYVAGGQAIAAGMFAGLLKSKIPVWTDTKLIELISDGKKIIGVVVEHKNKKITIKVNKGVILAAGGFDHNMPMRQQHQSSSLIKDLSLGAEGNTGDAITTAEKIGADIELMDQSWWFPAVAPISENVMPKPLLAERSLPGSFIVNQYGKRFINEATDYMSFGQKILELEKKGNSVKEMWLIFDQKYRNSYLFGGGIFPRMPIPQEWYKAGIAFSADTHEELARAINISEEDFGVTFDRFNKIAESGNDLDFGRGNSAYDQYYGDPTNSPNPNLRPLKGKMYAVKIVLSDLGTCGGLVADEYGRVLKADKTPIKGLYAIGNTAGNIFGKVYPGAGATISQGIVYGYIAADHAANSL